MLAAEALIPFGTDKLLDASDLEMFMFSLTSIYDTKTKI